MDLSLILRVGGFNSGLYIVFFLLTLLIDDCLLI